MGRLRRATRSAELRAAHRCNAALRQRLDEVERQFAELRGSIGIGTHEIVRAATDACKGGVVSREELTTQIRLVALHQEVKRLDAKINALHGYRAAAELPQLPEEAVVAIMDRLLRVETNSNSLVREMESVQRLTTQILHLKDRAVCACSSTEFAHRRIEALENRLNKETP